MSQPAFAVQIALEFRPQDYVRLIKFDDWNGQREVGLYWRYGSGREQHDRALAEAADQIGITLGLR